MQIYDNMDFSPENFGGPDVKMNPEVKKIWIEKMENENIGQTTSRLGTANGDRCCLGILCDIAVEQGVIPEPKPYYPGDENSTLVYGEGNQAEQAILPYPVAEWAGISQRGDMNFSPHGDAGTALSVLNDEGATFPQIAAIVREHF